MKSLQVVLGVLTALAFSASVALAGPSTLDLKKGDTAYVCGCGEKCGCKVLSKKAGKCNCGHDLTKVTVSKVEEKKAFYEIGGKEQSASLKGKYTCACEGDCCQMISQKEGKCPCGKDLIKVPEEKKAS